MKKGITIYGLLGLINNNPNEDIYIKFFDRDTGKEDVMWACLENIFDRLDNKRIFLNDKVEIIEEPKQLEEIEIENDNTSHFYIRDKHGTRCQMTKHSKIIAEKVNEIIRYIKNKENK